jgi:hypothetical protein
VHPVLVGVVLPEPDAEEHVVRVVIDVAQEVRVVGGDDRQPELGAELEDPRIVARLAFRIVRLLL